MSTAFLADLDSKLAELESAGLYKHERVIDSQQSAKIQQALDRVRQSYDSEYIRQWIAFFRDVLVDVPPNNKEAIQEFPGCMVVVSHDRYFLDRICTKILDLAHYEAGKYLDSL